MAHPSQFFDEKMYSHQKKRQKIRSQSFAALQTIILGLSVTSKQRIYVVKTVKIRVIESAKIAGSILFSADVYQNKQRKRIKIFTVIKTAIFKRCFFMFEVGSLIQMKETQ